MLEDNPTAGGTTRPFRVKYRQELRVRLVTKFDYAWRMVRKTPAASVVAVVSLALGIGANTTIFTPEDLYLVESRPQRLRTNWNYPDYRAMRDHNTVFEGLAAYSLGLQTIGLQPENGRDQASEITHGALVSSNYFAVLGVSPGIGRVSILPMTGLRARRPTSF
jgi:hypothetical protein